MNLLFAIERYTDLICRAAGQGILCQRFIESGEPLDVVYRAARFAAHLALEADKVRI